MSKKKQPETQLNRDEISYRHDCISFRAQSINEQDRSIEILASTENPVPMWDWQRGEVIPEVLLTSGAQWHGRGQVPLLDSHDRTSLQSHLGSFRGIEKTATGIKGRAFISETAQETWTKVREGHITDPSVGYRIIDRTYVPHGTKQNIMGRDFSGPVNVVTRWEIKELSLVPVGADPMATLRGEATTKENTVDKLLFDTCVRMGMPEDTSPEDAVRWLENYAKKEVVKVPQEETVAGRAEPKEDTAAIVERAFIEFEKRQAEKVEKFRKEVDDICEVAELVNPEKRKELYDLKDISEVRSKIKEIRNSERAKPGHAPIFQTENRRDNMYSAMRTLVLERALEPSHSEQRKKLYDDIFPAAERSKDASQYKSLTLMGIARECLRADGYTDYELSRLNNEQIAKLALGFQREAFYGSGMRDAGAYHVTGSFANLTLDAINKSMMLGYTEAPVTWRGPMREGSPVSDFKNVHRMRLGAIPNIPVWNDNNNPEQVSLKDAKETYAVEARSAEISFSYRLLINDDMDVLSRIPQQFGAAFARTWNTLAWKIISANALMSDGIALFSAASGARKRSNLTTGAGAPSVATLQTQSNLMRQMRGENTPEGNESTDILNLIPRYIVGPSALSTTINQLVLSAYDPASSLMVYNTATSLIPVIEPLLDGLVSTTAWFLFASPSQIDTVEIAFMQGQQTPQVREVFDQKQLAISYIGLQSGGGKAMNHRGIIKHAGA